MTKDYIPEADDKLLPWAQTLSDNIVTAGPTVGLSGAQIDTVQGNCKTIIGSINSNDAVQKGARQSTLSKTNTVSASKKILRGILQAVKTNSGYTNDIGANLGIIGSHSGIDKDTYSPEIEAVVFPGHITISFVKKGVDGVNIYTRLLGQTAWVKLSFDSHSPYVDNRPLSVAATPEAREYMAIGVIDDAEIGQMSKSITVVLEDSLKPMKNAL